MEDNSLNQNNQVGNNSVGVPVNQSNPVGNTVVGTSTIPNNQVTNVVNTSTSQGVITEVTGPSSNNTNTNSSKKKGQLIFFGVILIVAITLVATLFMENKEESESTFIDEKTKTLIVYFSKDGVNFGKDLIQENSVNLKVGNTEVLANKIKKFIDDSGYPEVELYKIIPKEPYDGTLDEVFERSKKEYNKDILVEITGEVKNLDDYDVVFIGYPLWHTSFPQVIKTFVLENQTILKTKKVIPFNTHAGSGSSGSHKKLYDLIGIKSEETNGIAIKGIEVEGSDNTVKNWLKLIGYNIK